MLALPARERHCEGETAFRTLKGGAPDGALTKRTQFFVPGGAAREKEKTNPNLKLPQRLVEARRIV